MKLRVSLLVLVALTMATAAQAQSSRIVFSTDRTNAGNFDIWKMQEDGDNPVEMTDETEGAFNPSISLDGEKVVYDTDGELWIMNADDSGSPAEIGECTTATHTACSNADAGPHLVGLGEDGDDFRIVFNRVHDTNFYDIWMATVDVGAGELTDLELLVYHTSSDGHGARKDPTWCGDDHIVYSRWTSNSITEREICVLEVDEDGPVGDPICYFDETSPAEHDVQPSCNADGSYIAWVRNEDIWVMDCTSGLDDCDDDNAENLMENDQDEYTDAHPVWSPSGTQIAFVSDRAGGDQDIFVMNASDGGSKTDLTDNSAEDIEPDWGGASL